MTDPGYIVYYVPNGSYARRVWIYNWPRGLNWYPVNRAATRWSYMIRSKGRNGAKVRQKLMTIRRDVISLRRP